MLTDCGSDVSNHQNFVQGEETPNYDNIVQDSRVDKNSLPSFKRLPKDVVRRRTVHFEMLGDGNSAHQMDSDENRQGPIVRHSPSKSPIWCNNPNESDSIRWRHQSETAPKSPVNGTPPENGNQEDIKSPSIAHRISLFETNSQIVNSQMNTLKSLREVKEVDESKRCDQVRNLVSHSCEGQGHMNQVTSSKPGSESMSMKNVGSYSSDNMGNLLTSSISAENSITPVNTGTLTRNRPATVKPALRPKPCMTKGVSLDQGTNLLSSSADDFDLDKTESANVNATLQNSCEDSISLPPKPIPPPRNIIKPPSESCLPAKILPPRPTFAPPKPPRMLPSCDDDTADYQQEDTSVSDYVHLRNTRSVFGVLGQNDQLFASNTQSIDNYNKPAENVDPDRPSKIKLTQSQSSSGMLSPLIQSRLLELTQKNDHKDSTPLSPPPIIKPKPLKPLMLDGEYRQDAWDKKFIRAPKLSESNDKFDMMSGKRPINPSYMYATVRRSDDIMAGRRAMLQRHKSDDMLDKPTPTSPNPGEGGWSQNSVMPSREADGSIYHDPNSLFPEVGSEKSPSLTGKRAVTFDLEGYAVPSVENNEIPLPSPRFRKNKNVAAGNQSNNNNNNYSDGHENSEQNRIKSKISNAYSVLRLRVLPGGDKGPGNTSEEDKESELDLEEHRKRLKHVTEVKLKTYEIVAKYEQVKLMSDKRLFQYALIVGLEPTPDPTDARTTYRPYVKFCFPKQVSDADKFASNLCFPDADMWQPMSSYSGDLFSFVLTNEKGERKFGWCWRYLAPGEGKRLPEAVCIVSPVGELALYEQLLKAVQSCRVLSLEAAEEIIQVAYARPFPAPNKEVYIRTVGPDFKKKTIILKRPEESRLNNVTFHLLFSKLSIDVLLQVFAALLLERKVIMFSKQLQTLTSCVFTITALLYPFEWQHTFVTVLPHTLIDLVEAPTPYLLGIHASMVPMLAHRNLEEVLVVNLDSSTLLYRVGDEGRIIPRKITRALHAALEEPDNFTCAVTGSSIPSAISNSTVTEAFLRLFVETCSHYTEYICTQMNGERVFQRELFVKAVTSRGIRMFLEWFTQTQMFEVFMTNKLKESSTPGLFEEKIMEYRQEMCEIDITFRDNVKAVGKKIVDFFKDSGDRIKKTFKKNVYV